MLNPALPVFEDPAWETVAVPIEITDPAVTAITRRSTPTYCKITTKILA
jgi:hypothetical protein